MDFRRAASKLAADLSGDLSMDPTFQDADLRGSRTEFQPDPETDGMDPATPGGSAPYNGAEPFSEPVVSNPMWRDPQDDVPSPHMPLPHTQGPDMNVTTLHSARRESYLAKEKGLRAWR